MKEKLDPTLDVIEGLCRNNRNWNYHSDSMTPQLVLKQIERLREILQSGKSLYSGERGRVTAIIDSGVRDTFYSYCEENNLFKNKALEKALIEYITNA